MGAIQKTYKSEYSVGWLHSRSETIDFTEKTLPKLGTILNRIVGCEVYFRVENISAPENKLTGVRILVP